MPAIQPRLQAAFVTIQLMALCTLSWPGRAQGQPSDRERATAMVVEGAEFYRRGDYRRALGNFQAAFSVFPSAKVQYNLGLAYRGLRRNAEAIMAFERFLRDAQDAPAHLLVDARNRVQQLEDKVARLSLACSAHDAEVLIDGTQIGRLPLSGPVPIEPGRHELVVRDTRLGTRTRTFTAVAGRPVQMSFDLRDDPAGNAVTAFRGPQPPTPEGGSGALAAEALIAEATALRRVGRHSKAYPLLARAYSAQTSARTAAQLGLVEMQLGYWLDSERHLIEGLASPRDPWIATNRDDLEFSLAQVKAAIGELVVSRAPMGSQVLANGKLAGTVPLAAPVRVGEGPLNVEIRPPGQPSQFRSLIILGGQRQEIALDVALPSPAAAMNPHSDAPADRSGPWSRSRPLAWTAAGLAAGALGFGLYETTIWRRNREDFESYRAPSGVSGPQTCGSDDPNRGAPGCANIYANFKLARSLAITGYVLGSALGAVAASMFVLSRRSGETGVAIACGYFLPTSGASCRLTF